MMIRHYNKILLKNRNHRNLAPPGVWELPPYEIARFSGELCQVIQKAVEQYISEKSYTRQQAIFNQKVHRKN